MNKKYIDVMDTTFRDGLDSVFGNHISMEHFLPAVSVASECGVTHFEFVERERFNSLDLLKVEEPFEMMVRFREAAGEEANLQINSHSLKGVMKKPMSEELVDLYTELFAKYETTTIRNYDPLNDVRNLEYGANSIVNAGMMHEATIILMDSIPGDINTYDLEYYENRIFDILDSAIPFDSIAFVDEIGTITPSKIYSIIKFAREILGEDMHIRVHTHDTLGMGIAVYLAALEAGADGIDLANSPVSGGASQPDMLSMLYAIKGTKYNLGDLELNKIEKYQNYLKEALSEYNTISYTKEIHPDTIFTPIPKSEILTYINEMKRDGNYHIFNKVKSKIADVIQKGGYGASVYPLSNYYWKQAYANAIFGDWRKITTDYGKMILGYYGKTPIVPDPKIVEIAKKQLNLSITTKKPIEFINNDKSRSINYLINRLEDKGIEPTPETLFLSACIK